MQRRFLASLQYAPANLPAPHDAGSWRCWLEIHLGWLVEGLGWAGWDAPCWSWPKGSLRHVKLGSRTAAGAWAGRAGLGLACVGCWLGWAVRQVSDSRRYFWVLPCSAHLRQKWAHGAGRRRTPKF